MSQIYKFTITEEDQGQRLDKFLTLRIKEVSRTVIKKWIDQEAVTVNQKASKGGYVLRQGDMLYLDQPPPEVLDVVAENIPLNILHEDADIVVIDKLAGMVVHPAPGHYTGTLVNALLYHCSDLAKTDDPFRPGIVHRLDKGTSGVMVVAKNDKAHRHLSQQFKDREVKKIYHAIVYGEIPQDEGVIESSIGRDRVYRQKISSRTQQGREAYTIFHVLKRGGGLSFVKVELKTGRTHQIRVHFSEKGYPLVGDDVYGGKNKWMQLKGQALATFLEALDRPLLQAVELEFIHPSSNEKVIFNSKLDKEFNEVLERMKS